MHYIADFETTVPDMDDDTIEDISTRVWSWGICELSSPDSFLYGTDISEFVDWCSKVQRIVYFHNLKFDGKFLIDYLLKTGYVYDEERKTPKSFTCLISEYGQFYSIEIVFKVWKRKRISTVFYDSSKKIPLSVADIAKSFNLAIRKGTIDYKKERPPGYEPSLEELAYLKDDVSIIGQALAIQHNQGLQRMTVGGDALFNYKTMVGTNFKRWFPDVFDENGIMFTELHMFYRGGFTYVHKPKRGQDIDQGVTYDVNSLYPSVMYSELLPYDQPIYFNGQYDEDMKDIYPLYCQAVSVEFTIKPGYIPFVHDRTGYSMKSVEYLEETGFYTPVTLYLTNIELELFFEHYDVHHIEYLGGYMFKGQHGMFTDYIDHWMDIKISADKEKNTGLKQIAKLMLNSLYGKFGKNVFVGGKFPYYDEVDKIVRYDNKPAKIEKGVYIPVAIFITSYARVKMITSAQACYDRFIYCDTDSLHIEGTEEPNTIDIDKYKLGAWKYEGTFKRARFLRPKAYIHEYTFKMFKKYKLVRTWLLVKCSGMSPAVKKKVTWDNFQIGFTATGKKQPKTIAGGVALIDTTYTLLE